MDMILSWGNNNHTVLNDKLRTLIEKMDQLESKANDIQCEVENEEFQARKKRKSEVKLWLERVWKIKEDVQSIRRDIENIGFRNPKELLNEIKGMLEEVDELLKQGVSFKGLVLDDLKPEGIELVTEKLEGSTPLKVRNEVWDALERGASRIGIIGMGGVGKTSVVMHFNNEIISGRDDFKHVYYVTVSQGSSVSKLQEVISKALKLSLQNEDETSRAAELHLSLKNREKTLLILDDVWEDIPMEKVGVALEGDGCKLLITTRKRDVCRKMKCSTIVEMKPLPENEAWDLFVSQLEDYELLSDEAKVHAKSIAEECSGLPLGIITMAKCMRGEFDEHAWRYMLRQLQNSSSEQDDMEVKVFNILKLSYERLNNAKLRECFLYCALYPEDYSIERDELIGRFIALGLIDDCTRQGNIDEGHYLLNALEGASLLESVTDDEGKICVKMHDLVRDMAIKIIGCTGIVKARKGLLEVPRKDEWTKDLVQVSLMDNDIRNIGDEICPECPNLSVLILRNNPLWNVSQYLFVHMSGLRILDLSCTDISELPSSISNLCSLSALLLQLCDDLSTIPSLAELTSLRELNLCGCLRIKEWPEGVDGLINLKHLDIRWTQIESMPDGVVYKLSKLECFLSNGKILMLPKKLMSLKQLRRLEGRIDDLDAVNQFVGSDYLNQLKMYSLHVGVDGDMVVSPSEVCRRIMLYNCQSSIGTQVSFKAHTVQTLELVRCGFGVKCLQDVLPSFCGASELEELFFDDCKGIEYIISDAWFKRGGHEVSKPLMRVQRLMIERLDGLVGLIEWGMVSPYICFHGLRELRIEDCPRLNKIWLQNDDLPNLKSITLINCGSIEELFATTEVKCLPMLQELNLYMLFKLRSICRKGFFSPKLQKLEVQGLPKLKKLGLLNHSMPFLDEIMIGVCNELEEIFDRDDEAGHDAIQLPSLRKIKLYDLSALKGMFRNGVFSPKLQKLEVQRLPKLKKLGLLNHSMPFLDEIKIEDCNEMEEMFDMDDEAGHDAIQLPSLWKIKLYNLSALKGVFRNGVFSPKLQQLCIWECPKLKNLEFLNHNMPSLREISIRGCEEMEDIFDRGDVIQLPSLRRIHLTNLAALKSIYILQGVFFPELQELEIRECPKLKRIGLLNHNTPSIVQIRVQYCEQMEEIFARGDEAGDEVIQLPNLRVLHLTDLPELRSICNKTLACNSIKEVRLGGLSSASMKLENFPISVPRLLLNNNPPHPKLFAYVDMPSNWWLCQHKPKDWFN